MNEHDWEDLGVGPGELNQFLPISEPWHIERGTSIRAVQKFKCRKCGSRKEVEGFVAPDTVPCRGK